MLVLYCFRSSSFKCISLDPIYLFRNICLSIRPCRSSCSCDLSSRVYPFQAIFLHVTAATSSQKRLFYKRVPLSTALMISTIVKSAIIFQRFIPGRNAFTHSVNFSLMALGIRPYLYLMASELRHLT